MVIMKARFVLDAPSFTTTCLNCTHTRRDKHRVV